MFSRKTSRKVLEATRRSLSTIRDLSSEPRKVFDEGGGSMTVARTPVGGIPLGDTVDCNVYRFRGNILEDAGTTIAVRNFWQVAISGNVFIIVGQASGKNVVISEDCGP